MTFDLFDVLYFFAFGALFGVALMVRHYGALSRRMSEVQSERDRYKAALELAKHLGIKAPAKLEYEQQFVVIPARPMSEKPR